MEFERKKLQEEIDILSREKEAGRRQKLEILRDEIRGPLSALEYAVSEAPEDDPVGILIAIRSARVALKEKSVSVHDSEAIDIFGRITKILKNTEDDITRFYPVVAELANQKEEGQTVQADLSPDERYRAIRRMQQTQKHLQPHIEHLRERLRQLGTY